MLTKVEHPKFLNYVIVILESKQHKNLF